VDGCVGFRLAASGEVLTDGHGKITGEVASLKLGRVTPLLSSFATTLPTLPSAGLVRRFWGLGALTGSGGAGLSSFICGASLVLAVFSAGFATGLFAKILPTSGTRGSTKTPSKSRRDATMNAVAATRERDPAAAFF
jgi:hypothetical protein